MHTTNLPYSTIYGLWGSQPLWQAAESYLAPLDDKAKYRAEYGNVSRLKPTYERDPWAVTGLKVASYFLSFGLLLIAAAIIKSTYRYLYRNEIRVVDPNSNNHSQGFNQGPREYPLPIRRTLSREYLQDDGTRMNLTTEQVQVLAAAGMQANQAYLQRIYLEQKQGVLQRNQGISDNEEKMKLLLIVWKESDCPTEFECPISKEVFSFDEKGKQPVIVLEDGSTYAREWADNLVKQPDYKSPYTRKTFKSCTVQTNMAILTQARLIEVDGNEKWTWVCPLTKETYNKPYYCIENGQTYSLEAFREQRPRGSVKSHLIPNIQIYKNLNGADNIPQECTMIEI